MKENNSENEILENITFIKDLGMLFASDKSKRKHRYGLYKCGLCGNEFRSRVQDVKSNKIKSCGCTKNFLSQLHNLSNTKLYKAWYDIKSRTLNPKHKDYPNYGGRGITICDEWKDDFMSFYAWAILNGYEENKGLSIDRINNDGNYEPNNCRWVDRTIQSRNQRIYKNNTSGYKGVSHNKRQGNYRALINVNRKKISLGNFKTAIEGAIAYNNYIIENSLEGFILNDINLTQEM